TPGSTITYVITINNAGPGAQADNPGHELTDVLPSQLQLVSATASSGTTVATIGTNTVTWDGSIAAGGSVTITIQATIKLTVTAGTTVMNQGTISFDADGNGTNEASGVTDDPGQTGSANQTPFVVAAPVAAVPALDGLALAALAMMLAAMGVVLLKR
ncbi:MAG: hypothetical protein ACXVIJ_14925, partial [Thermoanaerobaculia bacterium]